MIRYLLRVIKDKKPKYFVAENVAGLCSIGGYETREDRKNQTGRVLKVILEEQEEGGYTVYVPALSGCISEGDTLEEAVENIKEAIELYLDTDIKDINKGKILDIEI